MVRGNPRVCYVIFYCRVPLSLNKTQFVNAAYPLNADVFLVFSFFSDGEKRQPGIRLRLKAINVVQFCNKIVTYLVFFPFVK